MIMLTRSRTTATLWSLPRGILQHPTRLYLCSNPRNPPYQPYSSSSQTKSAEKIPSTKLGDSKKSFPKSSAPADGPFISKHFLPQRAEIFSFVTSRDELPLTTDNPEVILVKCPECSSKPGGSFRPSLRINLRNGNCHCSKCATDRTWQEYIKSVRRKTGESFTVYKSAESLGSQTAKPAFLKAKEEIEQFPSELNNNRKMMEWLTEDMRLDRETLQLYKVGIATYSDLQAQLAATKNPSSPPRETLCVTFPQTAPDYSAISGRSSSTTSSSNYLNTQTVRIKACRPNATALNQPVALDPPKIFSFGLFGYHVAPLSADTVILTRDEFSAMAAYQHTGLPAFSLPNPYNQLPEGAIPLLERFDSIYIWLDDDTEGQAAAERFAHKLGSRRCFIVRTRGGELEGPRNAHEMLLRRGVTDSDFEELIEAAQRLSHDQIIGFRDFKEEIRRDILDPDQARGVQSNDLPGLNDLLKGHRTGELSIWTGPTGIGKTTVLSQLSLDYCKSGVSTLWGSFEIQNPRLAKKMLYQLAEKNLSKFPEEFDVWADQVEKLPLYFLKFFGSTSVKDVLSACNHAVYAFDVSHIILDNLQFMLSGQHRANTRQDRGMDRWELQDDTISQLRAFATDRNVHISLVVHPRKTSEDQTLDTASVFGSAKVTQEADNVIIVQKKGDLRFLDVRKNRYDGTVGSLPFIFNPESLKIRQYTEREAQALRDSLGGRQRQDDQPKWDENKEGIKHQQVKGNRPEQMEGVGPEQIEDVSYEEIDYPEIDYTQMEDEQIDDEQMPEMYLAEGSRKGDSKYPPRKEGSKYPRSEIGGYSQTEYLK